MSWRVLLAEDHARIRRLLTDIIDADPSFDVVGHAVDGAQAATECERLRPDLVLMDVVMRPVNGVDGTRLIMRRVPGTKVLALTSYAQSEWLVEMLRAGACGYLAKESTPEELVKAMTAVVTGSEDYAFSPAIVSVIGRHLSAPAPGPPAPPAPGPLGGVLTDRELELVSWLAGGLSNRLIGQRMRLTEASVKTALSRIMKKLDVADRVQVVIRCHKLGLVHLSLARDTEPPHAGRERTTTTS
ncbi:response regulator [Micropruina sp.]|uniref:response regulator n=1 Tax=Micropruina sp. TaxID=2737536 RepID=UPI0039E33F1F